MTIHLKKIALTLAGLAAVVLGMNYAGAQNGGGSESPYFHKGGATEIYSGANSRTEFLLTAEESKGRFSIVDETFFPGMNSAPGHTHHFHSEVFFIISGSMEWTVGDETDTLGAGDLVYIPPGTVHYTHVVGDEPVRALMIYEPAGYERGYFSRRALTDEQRQDPEFMRQFMHSQDVDPVRGPGGGNATSSVP